jgi:hypothetical protein
LVSLRTAANSGNTDAALRLMAEDPVTVLNSGGRQI